MASFFRSSVGDFLAISAGEILARLTLAYADQGYTRQFSDQTLTWERDIQSLRQALTRCLDRSPFAMDWGLMLEFAIPRKESRIDAIVLVGSEIVVLEAKSGSADLSAKRQVQEYALLLHYFHKASSDRRIVPLIVSPDAPDAAILSLRQTEMFPHLATYWINDVLKIRWDGLADVLIAIGETASAQISLTEWDESFYFPVPTIIEAALALRSGLSIREIAHSEASELEIETVRRTIQRCVDEARSESRHVICFLTGVPGSGKTLVGLSLAHSHENQGNAIHFMSGNGPLVKVIQHLFTQQARKEGDSVTQARVRARTLIENVHVFAKYHMEDNLRDPSNHAIIFDEAQRAWNRSQNKRKFNRDYSEPEMLLGIMERHHDWAAVVALVGGGQEINDGEAGLEEWGRALLGSAKEWVIYASPDVLDGGPSTAGHRLFEVGSHSKLLRTSHALHLRTSNRSLRAEKLAAWVNFVLDGNAEEARNLRVTERFPIFLSRDLDEVRCELRRNGLGATRYGLVGSSGAARLRAEGLEPSSAFHADYPWEHWYLAPEEDLRSSYRCEVFATEFEIQGLELDWIGLCWGGDCVWDESKGWQLRVLRPGLSNRWCSIKKAEKRIYRKNAYRVLLTRARQGMVVFVPPGDDRDPTNSPFEFNSTAEFLLRCGVTPLT